MELTVGGTIHRLDRTINEEVTHFTTASNTSVSSNSNAAHLAAAAAARRAARQAAFRASKNSSGVSFDAPPTSAMSPDDPMASKFVLNQKQVFQWKQKCCTLFKKLLNFKRCR